MGRPDSGPAHIFWFKYWDIVSVCRTACCPTDQHRICPGN